MQIFLANEKQKVRTLFCREIFLPAGPIELFSKKSGTDKKFTPEKKSVSKLYIRLSDNYPIIASLTYTSFSR